MVSSFKPRYRPIPKTVSAPLAIPLTRPSAWHNNGDADGPYDVVRLNFLVEQRPLLETGYGDATASIVSSANAQMQSREKVTFEYEEVDSTSLVQEHLQSSGLTAKMNADLRLGSESFGTAEFSSALEEHFTETFQSTRTIASARTKRYTREEEVTVTVPGGDERAVHAAPYRLHEMTVRLNHVDFLAVTYAPTRPGLRVRRVKRPELATDDRVHQNFTAYGQLLGRYRFWRPEGNASQHLISVTEHEANHINPHHVSFEPDDTNDNHFYGLGLFSRTPSLYKISNAAFPLKESQRRDSWTEDDLHLLQDWEVRDSAWVWENMRRQRRAALKRTATG
ncbi:hypothetical protein [Microbacterium sp. P04]|uniref:hypothetical protein n=1 Tax=Microbacterium sp. P04 TaxID=3366947 RepID=UPI003744FAD3